MMNKQTILAAAAVIVSCAAPAFSQTLVRDVDKPGYLPYQFTQSVEIKIDPEGYLVFPAPPAGKRLVIEHTSIKLTVGAQSKVACEMGGSVAGFQGTLSALHTFGAPGLLYNTGIKGNDFYSISEA